MINQERLKEIEAKELYSGAGNGIDHACVMQMVSYIANEPWSDRPACACPILTRYAIRLNDSFKHEHRQLFKPFIISLVGTRENDETQIARKRFFMFRHVTAVYPLLLDLWKLPELSAELQTFANTLDGMAKAAALLKTNKSKIYANAFAYAYANANADAYAYACANAYADAYDYADAYAYADADADAYAYADAGAYAYANAGAYAYANALKEKIVAVSLETLRLAIEIKVSNENTTTSN